MTTLSPRYSPARNQDPTDSRSDAKVSAALAALQHVAAVSFWVWYRALYSVYATSTSLAARMEAWRLSRRKGGSRG